MWNTRFHRLWITKYKFQSEGGDVVQENVIATSQGATYFLSKALKLERAEKEGDTASKTERFEYKYKLFTHRTSHVFYHGATCNEHRYMRLRLWHLPMWVLVISLDSTGGQWRLFHPYKDCFFLYCLAHELNLTIPRMYKALCATYLSCWVETTLF